MISEWWGWFFLFLEIIANIYVSYVWCFSSSKTKCAGERCVPSSLFCRQKNRYEFPRKKITYSVYYAEICPSIHYRLQSSYTSIWSLPTVSCLQSNAASFWTEMNFFIFPKQHITTVCEHLNSTIILFLIRISSIQFFYSLFKILPSLASSGNHLPACLRDIW